MGASLMDLNLPVLNLVVRGTVVYLVILILLRLSGKREVGQMGPTELVAILLISNAVQNSMNGGDTSLLGGLVLAAVLVLLSTMISILTYRSAFFERVFEGVPRLIIHEGRLIEKNLVKERLSRNELHVLMRKQGVHHLKDIRTAVLEADGTLSLVRFSDS